MGSDTKAAYGGQAVIEGVMIRGQRNICVAVRRPDGTIAIDTQPLSTLFTGTLRRVPMVRGMLVLIETLGLGMRALAYSANVAARAEEQEIGRGVIAATLAVSVSFGVLLFFLVPVLASRPLEGVLGSDMASNFVEGLIRLSLFLGYVYLIGRMQQIRRVFMYHGAEHMTVHAREHGNPLDVNSIRPYPTAHPRCGTAFLLTVMIVAVLVFTFVGRDPLWWLIASRIVLIPVIAAISYEAIRFSGAHGGNPVVRILSAPNIALQSLTTRRPTDDQIEVAIAAMDGALSADTGRTTPNGG